MKSPIKLAVALLCGALAVNPVVAADDSFIAAEAARAVGNVVVEADPTAYNRAITYMRDGAEQVRNQVAENVGPYVASARAALEGTRAYQWMLENPRQAAAIVITPLVGGALYYAVRNRNAAPAVVDTDGDADLALAIAMSLETPAFDADEAYARQLQDEEYARFVQAEEQPVVRENTADDEAVARRLQAQYDAEIHNVQGRRAAEQAEQEALEQLLNQIALLAQDEAAALALQEQMDREAAGELYPAYHEYSMVEAS